MALLDVQHLTFAYPGQGEPVLSGLSFQVEAGSFTTLCGPSGCGKTTLLRLLKPELRPNGSCSGDIQWEGAPLSGLDRRRSAQDIGFVQQSPDNQLVTDQVWHELAFGLESLGKPQGEIRRRTAEIAAFFGLEPLFHRPVHRLSGGQKQLVNLAAALTAGPKLLILDEPTSQLDPGAASAFLETLHRVNQELGITVLLCEHRLEHAFSLSTQVIVLEEGRLLCHGTPQAVGRTLCRMRHPMAAMLPAPMEIYACVPNALPCPASVAQGRLWLQRYAKDHPLAPVEPEAEEAPAGEPCLDCRDVWFGYAPGQPVLRGLSLSLYPGQILALVGQNGSGKSTALSLLAGLRQPERGEIHAAGKVAAVPQDPQVLFQHNTLGADLAQVCRDSAQVEEMAKLCRVGNLLDRHPYDLSGGEQQRAALAKVLLTRPKILLLDEPTKGLDGGSKKILAALLRDLGQAGAAIVLVSHDMEFCARYASRCSLLAQGTASPPAPPRRFFSGNLFYTTAVSRMTRGILPGAVTPEDVIRSCGGQPWSLPEPQSLPLRRPPAPPAASPARWRQVLGWAGGLCTLVAYLSIARVLPRFLSANGLYGLMFAGLACLAAAAWRPGQRQERLVQPLGKGAGLAAVLIALAMPLTVLFGPTVFAFAGRRAYYLTSLMVIVEGIAPFFLIFEGRRPQARELVLLASLCALNVAGRAAFFMLPMFKPVAAITIVAAVAFGGETGFLVGSVTMLLSNMLFGQGAWTPWQMFAMGLVGFLAGVLTRLGLLGRGRAGLAVFGFFVVLCVYGPIMDASGVFMWQGEPRWSMLLAYLASGLPVNLLHGGATAFFLWFGAPALLEKLDRIKVKYGIL